MLDDLDLMKKKLDDKKDKIDRNVFLKLLINNK
jgi:hypothetical protein